jgi:hypothetical protein
MPPGPSVRVDHDSGVVLKVKPFSLAVVTKAMLCDVHFGQYRIRTLLCKMQ